MFLISATLVGWCGWYERNRARSLVQCVWLEKRSLWVAMSTSFKIFTLRIGSIRTWKSWPDCSFCGLMLRFLWYHPVLSPGSSHFFGLGFCFAPTSLLYTSTPPLHSLRPRMYTDFLNDKECLEKITKIGNAFMAMVGIFVEVSNGSLSYYPDYPNIDYHHAKFFLSYRQMRRMM